jgi:polysaccharide export outer membrane protein
MISNKTSHATLLLLLLATASCASPRLSEAGSVSVVAGNDLPPPTHDDLIVGARPHLIGAGDTIAVDVFGLPELSRQVQVDANGDVAVPLAGTVEALGRTPEELSRQIELALRSNSVRDPRVTVGVVETVSQVVTVDGEVERPGVYPVIGPATLMTTIARAEGTTEFARTTHVVVFRTVEGRRMAALYDLRAIRIGAYDDPKIYSNDMVVVGESNARRLFPQIAQMASLILTPLIYIVN